MVREKKVRVKVVTEYNWKTMSAVDRGDLETAQQSKSKRTDLVCLVGIALG